MRPFLLITLFALLPLFQACDSAAGPEAGDEASVLAAQQSEITLIEALALTRETVVSELTESQFLDFCSISMSVMANRRSKRSDPAYACVGEGLYAIYSPGSEENPTTCEAERDACFAASEPYQPPAPTTCDTSYLAQATACSITIGEYEDCVQGIDETMAMIDVTLTCEASLEQALEMQALYTATAPAICDVLEAQCPLFAETLP